MSERASKRRSVRQLAGRKRASIYYEPDTDDDFDDETTNEQHSLPETQPHRKKQKRDRRSRPQTRSNAQSRRQGQLRSGKPSGRPKKTHSAKKSFAAPSKKKEKRVEGFTGPSDGRIPNWTNLPIEILRDIFIYASQPRHEQTTTAITNTTWLLRTARRTCRAFAIPALEAYYQSPYPLTNLQPHHLLELMQMPVEKTYIKYKVKVKSLEIDVRKLAYSATGKSRFDLGDLVHELPQLQHLEVVHPVDTPPFRALKIQPWRYPPHLFGSLADSGARLKSWRWNRDMIPIANKNVYAVIDATHSNKAFAYLERLVVCGFDVNDSLELQFPDEEPERLPPRLATCVSKLRHLKNLTFISCDLIMNDFLEHIPMNLERLELSNCLEVTSEMLKRYLFTGGSQLRGLVLNHNPALDLTFLPRLKELCPKLEVLMMDLTYYSERYNFNDAWAMYDHLLTQDDSPSWPTTLQHLELVNLQKWEAEAAQNLFRSLVDNAKDLQDLQHLVIQAHINIPWRDRAGFRDQWIERLQRIYLRKNEEPNPYLGSLRQFRLWKRARTGGRVLTEPADLQRDDETETRHRLSHVRVTPRKPPPDADFFEEPGPSDKNTSKPARRSVRVAEKVESQHSASPPAEDSSSDSEGEAEEDWRQEPEAFIQGRCRVVDIRIDNQRPRENQYTEANFLDSEPSGDEDWHSGAELSDDGYAW